MFSTEQDRMMITTPVYHPFTDIVLNTKRTLVNIPLIAEWEKYKMNFDIINMQYKVYKKHVKFKKLLKIQNF